MCRLAKTQCSAKSTLRNSPPISGCRYSGLPQRVFPRYWRPTGNTFRPLYFAISNGMLNLNRKGMKSWFIGLRIRQAEDFSAHCCRDRMNVRAPLSAIRSSGTGALLHNMKTTHTLSVGDKREVRFNISNTKLIYTQKSQVYGSRGN